MDKGYAIITGASSGLGTAFAKLLAAKEYNLILVARRAERLQSIKVDILKSSTIDIHVVSLDLAQSDAAEKLVEYTNQHKLTISVLINNAGYGMNGNFMDLSIDKTTEMLQLNMTTLTKLSYFYGKQMLENKHGYILQVASIGAFQPTPFFAAYSATKAYVMLFSEALDFELKGSGVSVTTLYPGATKTEFFDVADAKVNKLVERTLMTPEQVAAIAINAMFNRKRSIVPGLINKISSFLTQLSPRKIATWSAANVMK